MNAQRYTILAASAALLVCVAPQDARAQQTYTFPKDSQGWQSMGFYDDGGLSRLPGFVQSGNPWTNIDGNGGAILVGQEGATPQNPGPEEVVHFDLNSPNLNYVPGRSFEVTYDVTGSHMVSDAQIWVQTVLVVRLPNELSDRRYGSAFQPVPLGEDGAWETVNVTARFPAGTTVKKINFRVFFEAGTPYNGWILLDNVSLR
jgi:hypothetical protein